MHRHHFAFGCRLLVAGVALGTVLAAQAQSTTTTTGSSGGGLDPNRSSWIPYTHSGYIGLSAGRSNFSNGCVTGLRCDNNDTMGKIYLGGYFNPHWGAEIGYVDMGDAEIAGGRTSAHGINLSVVGRVPVAERFSLFGRLGATYGRTRVSALPGTGLATGSESGWGPAYGVGASWDISRNWSAVLEWERTRFRFAGGDREGVSATSLGIRYNF